MHNLIGTGSNHPQTPLLQPNFEQQQAPHIMPSPTTSPWSLNAMPWTLATPTMQPGAVMEFTSSALTADKRAHQPLHQKRKSVMTVSIPQKQFISEEKITAHFNGLHISSDYIQTINTSNAASGTTIEPNSGQNGVAMSTATTTGKCFTNLTYEDYQITARQLEQKLRNANRITLCDEINKLNEEQRKVAYLTDPLLMMHRIIKPCTALVLWQPPPIIELLKRGSPDDVVSPLQPYGRIEEVDSAGGEVDAEIDDFLDNNNTCSVDFNNIKADMMDEDL